MDHNLKIVVLGGGISTERQVSLVTATSVCKALRSSGYKAVFVDMFLGVEDPAGRLEDIFDAPDGLCGSVSVGRDAPDIEEVIASRKDQSASRIGKNVLEICKMADCVFLGLHGKDGEDGKIQALLDLFGIPYTGSGSVGSAMALDKGITRMVMQANGIRCAPLTDHAPCVVKCANGGSSIGTYICNTEEEYRSALDEVKKYDTSFLVEQKINGTELTVPVLDGTPLAPIEIVPPQSGKFDYVAKYQSGSDGAREICPARLSAEKTLEVQKAAKKLHEALHLSVYSRTDFIMDEHGDFWCLEINTLPGLTPNSLLPKSAANAGIDYQHLCESIIRLSMDIKR